MLSGQDILAACNGKPLEPITQAAWGGQVCLLRMTADQSDGMYVYWREHGNPEDGS